MGNATLKKTSSERKLDRRAPDLDEACQKQTAAAVEFSAPFIQIMERRLCAAPECTDCLDPGTGPLMTQPQGHVPRDDLPTALPFTLCQSASERELKKSRSHAVRKARVTVSLGFC